MNSTIIRQFKLWIQFIRNQIMESKNFEIKKKHSYRLSKVENALRIIIRYNKKIISGEQLKHLNGIGDGIVRRINEVIKYGYIKEIQHFDKPQIKSNLTDIIGIGKKNQNILINKYKIHNIRQLIDAHNKKKIKLSNTILKGIKYHKVYKKNIPREEIKLIYEYLKKIIPQFSKSIIFNICGSFRRKKKNSNDIDLLISSKNKDEHILGSLIIYLKKKKFIIDSITSDYVNTKYMGFIQFKKFPVRKIDIRYIPYESYYYSLLYYTGSKNFNKYIRLIAKKKGLLLNEYGLFSINNKKKLIFVDSEKEIFKLLNINYISPKNRE